MKIKLTALALLLGLTTLLGACQDSATDAPADPPADAPADAPAAPAE